MMVGNSFLRNDTPGKGICRTMALLMASLLLYHWNDSRVVQNRVFVRRRPCRATNTGTAQMHRRLHTDQPINVTINLELYYVNETLADLLSPQVEPWNDISSHFCWAVSQQASGTQVQLALEGTGTVIDTHVFNTSFGCSILQTDQFYDSRGEILLGDGFNIVLQLQVQQLVYLSSGSLLSPAEVNGIVNLGFKRGAGGRAAFLSLLREDPGFSTILNVEVFTFAPSESPTTQPSLVPTEAPSPVPTPVPTEMPSAQTSTFSPSLVFPNKPSLSPNHSEAPVGDTRVILASVLGGLAVLLAGCVVLLCAWFPICGNKYDDMSDLNEKSDRHWFSTLPRSQSFQCSNIQHADSVDLDSPTHADDESSRQRRRRRTVGATVGIGVAESFDEISIYTAGTGSESAVHRSYPGLLSDAALALSNMKRSKVESVSFDSNGSSTRLGIEVFPEKGASRFPPPAMSIAKNDMMTHTKMVHGSSKEYQSGDADMGNTASLKISGQGHIKQATHQITKGYDPFLDDERGSNGSTNFVSEASSSHDEETNEPIKKSISRVTDELSQRSASSSQTPKVQNTSTKDNLSPTDYEEKREVDGLKENEWMLPMSQYSLASPWENEMESNDGATTTFSAMSNNTLLRSILEDARRLSQHSESPKAATSKNLSPGWTYNRISDVPKENGKSKVQSPLMSVAKADTKAHSSHFEKGRDRASSPNLSPPKIRSTVRNESQYAGAPRRRDLPLELYHWDPTSSPVREHFDHSATMRDHNVIFVPKDPEPMISGKDILGAEPRISTYNLQMSETPSSSPGTLGIAPKEIYIPHDDDSSGSQDTGDPWLFDTIEQTLGPRSPVADMESISGRSGKSGKSNRSTKFSRRSTGPSGYTQTKKMALSNDSTVSSEVSTQRFLEKDLATLEIHVPPGRDPEQTSSFTASSAGFSAASPSKHSVSRSGRLTHKEIIVPAGKLGVILADRHDGRGIIVSEVKAQSTVSGKLLPGDKLIEVDGQDVSKLLVSEIIELMASKIDYERRITVVTSISLPPDVLEEKSGSDNED